MDSGSGPLTTGARDPTLLSLSFLLWPVTAVTSHGGRAPGREVLPRGVPSETQQERVRDGSAKGQSPAPGEGGL